MERLSIRLNDLGNGIAVRAAINFDVVQVASLIGEQDDLQCALVSHFEVGSIDGRLCQTKCTSR